MHETTNETTETFPPDNRPDLTNGHANGQAGPVQEETENRTAEPVDLEQLPRLPFVVVGVGASAGGLEAYTEFLEGARSDSGMAFVLIQHLSPKHQSIMAELLSKHTDMPVLQVDDRMRVEPNHVYVIRPGHTMTIHNGRLLLGEPAHERGHRRPVDDFFKSLAEEQRERAVCVLLSGTGSNGTAGAEMIKAVGGLCIAQNPETAKFPSMPRSLIDAGLADFILKSSEIFDALARFAAHPYARRIDKSADAVAQNPAGLGEILAVLRARTRHDFSGYKHATIVRRIQRRMGLLEHSEMTDYAKALRQSPGEVTALADDLQIHVTGFFRDPEVWETLRRQVIEPLVAERAEDSPIRCWVTACSSGEEAYTLAILLSEAMQASGKRFDVKIFATDTAERSLTQARAGTFPGGIESEITPERLDRYFVKDDAFYHVRKELRELVVFAPQNVLQDPPFSRLDICTCRNLLIYLEPATQWRVLSLLHFGLREGGTLLLGSSETIGGVEDLFQPIDKKARVFRRSGPTRHGAIDFPSPPALRGRTPQTPPSDDEIASRMLSRTSIAQLATRVLLSEYTPASVVVDQTGQIVYFHGNTGLFLDQPRGEPTRDLLALAREPIRGAIRHALHRAKTYSEKSSVRDIALGDGDEQRTYEVTVAQLSNKPSVPYYLLSFQERDLSVTTDFSPLTDVQHESLSDDLRRARDELQSAIEELQTSNEEMKASHEEVTSINEELQSANEELETSKEELQSLNEELTTVNTQLQSKMEEVERTGNDLASLLASTDIAVVFLDMTNRIRRYTPSVIDLFELIPTDIGRPLSDLARKFTDLTLLDDIQQVRERLVPIQCEISSQSGHWYVRRVLPYRTSDNRIDGIVITFVDITERRKAESALRANEERLQRVVKVDAVGVAFFDDKGRITDANDEMLRLIGHSRQELSAGAIRWEDLTPPEWQTRTDEADAELSLSGRVMAYEKEYVRKDGTRWWGVVAGARVGPNDIVVYIVDVTQRRQAEAALQVADRLKDEFLATLSHELRTPIAAILIWTKLLRDHTPTPEALAEGLDAIERSADAQKQLIDDLLDSARITSGNLRLEMRETDLAEVVREAIHTIDPTAEAKQVTIETDFGSDLGIFRADPDRLRQVIWNLLTNAVKFTPEDGTVKVGVWRSDGSVTIRVADTGKGIEPSFLPNVFDRFRQAGGTTTRSSSGLGLGLAIVKQLVELHGGTITAESAGVGKGATFNIILPLTPVRISSAKKAQRAARKAAATPFASGQELQGKTVLLVEDQVPTRDALVSLSKRAGADVTSVGSVPDALVALGRQHPDILLSDIGLPGRDGYELIRQIRADEAAAQTDPLPAIALTAFARKDDQSIAEEAGFDQFVTKPFEPTLLLELIRSLLDARV